jgi:competence ComEA-like helix-hairpin-helix protein
MLTNSERKVLIFIIIVLVCGGLAGFLREDPLKETEKHVSFPVNINTATKEELILLPNIGPVIAGRILSYRDKNNGFKTKNEILEIKGIGEVTFKEIEDKICVENPEEVKNNLNHKVHKEHKKTDCGFEDKNN